MPSGLEAMYFQRSPPASVPFPCASWQPATESFKNGVEMEMGKGEALMGDGVP